MDETYYYDGVSGIQLGANRRCTAQGFARGRHPAEVRRLAVHVGSALADRLPVRAVDDLVKALEDVARLPFLAGFRVPASSILWCSEKRRASMWGSRRVQFYRENTHTNSSPHTHTHEYLIQDAQRNPRPKKNNDTHTESFRYTHTPNYSGPLSTRPAPSKSVPRGARKKQIHFGQFSAPARNSSGSPGQQIHDAQRHDTP